MSSSCEQLFLNDANNYLVETSWKVDSFCDKKESVSLESLGTHVRVSLSNLERDEHCLSVSLDFINSSKPKIKEFLKVIQSKNVDETHKWLLANVKVVKEFYNTVYNSYVWAIQKNNI